MVGFSVLISVVSSFIIKSNTNNNIYNYHHHPIRRITSLYSYPSHRTTLLFTNTIQCHRSSCCFRKSKVRQQQQEQEHQRTITTIMNHFATNTDDQIHRSNDESHSHDHEQATLTHKQEDEQEQQQQQYFPKKHYKVVIVGAGMSGLQCCNTILELCSQKQQQQEEEDEHTNQQKSDNTNITSTIDNKTTTTITIDDILLLEARDRIGGRVYTTIETGIVANTTVTSQYNDDDDDNNKIDINDGSILLQQCNGTRSDNEKSTSNSTIAAIQSKLQQQQQQCTTIRTFPLDHGAAWVHGIGTIPLWDHHHLKKYNDDDDDDCLNDTTNTETDTIISDNSSSNNNKDNHTIDNHNATSTTTTTTMATTSSRNNMKELIHQILNNKGNNKNTILTPNKENDTTASKTDVEEEAANDTNDSMNPIMYLLLQQQLQELENEVGGRDIDSNVNNRLPNDTKTDIDNNYDSVVYPINTIFHSINPVVKGNPWMRPRSVLHKDNKIVLYVAGQQLLYQNDINNNNNNNNNNNDINSKTNNNNITCSSRIINKALQRHYTILRHVQEIGMNMYENGNGMDTSTTSLHSTIQHALSIMFPPNNDNATKADHIDDDETEQMMISAIAPFYMLLLECWYGCEVSALQICEFIEDKSRIIDEEDTYYTPEGDFIGPHCTVNNGMSTILQPLLKNGIMDRIMLNEEVTKIEYRKTTDESNNHPDTSTTTTIEPKTNDNSNCIYIETKGGLNITTDTCVVTIPAGCLKDAVLTRNIFSATTTTCATTSHTPAAPTITSAAANTSTITSSDATTSKSTTTLFSNDKLQAISLLKMGSYKKVFLTFDRIFWPIEPPFIGLIRNVNNSATATSNDGDGDCLNKKSTENSSTNYETYYKTQSIHPIGNCLLIDNLWAKRYGVASLEVVLFGVAGTWSIHKDDYEICDAILHFMSDAMLIPISELQEYYVSCHITRWEEDIYSRGAYSSMAIGATERHVEELRRPEWDNRLVFSGEATISEYEGSVYAAMYSGMNAAKSIYQYFS